jgi:hypothetical protein
MKLGHLGLSLTAARSAGGGETVLRREGDGSVTVLSVATPPAIALVRNGDGTVTITGSATDYRYRINGGSWVEENEALPFNVPGATAPDTVDAENFGPIVNEAAALVRSKTFVATIGAGGGGGQVATGSVDLGAEGATRFVVVGVMSQNDTQATQPTVVVAGVTLTQIHANAGGTYFVSFYGGLVPTGAGLQTATVTFVNAAFAAKMAPIWVLRDLASTTPIASGSATGSGPTGFAVNAGDYLLMIRLRDANAQTLSGSTQAPDRASDFINASWNGWSADWTIASTTASFNPGLTSPVNEGAYIRFA